MPTGVRSKLVRMEEAKINRSSSVAVNRLLCIPLVILLPIIITGFVSGTLQTARYISTIFNLAALETKRYKVSENENRRY